MFLKTGSVAGAAVVFAFVSKDARFPLFNITVGHLGDSRAVLIRADGRCQALTTDHRPDDSPADRARCRALGVNIGNNRVDGLGLARAIGDK